MHARTEAPSLLGSNEAGGRADNLCGRQRPWGMAGDLDILCGGEAFAIPGSMDRVDQRTTTTATGVDGEQCTVLDIA